MERRDLTLTHTRGLAVTGAVSKTASSPGDRMKDHLVTSGSTLEVCFEPSSAEVAPAPTCSLARGVSGKDIRGRLEAETRSPVEDGRLEGRLTRAGLGESHPSSKGSSLGVDRVSQSPPFLGLDILGRGSEVYTRVSRSQTRPARSHRVQGSPREQACLTWEQYEQEAGTTKLVRAPSGRSSSKMKAGSIISWYVVGAGSVAGLRTDGCQARTNDGRGSICWEGRGEGASE